MLRGEMNIFFPGRSFKSSANRLNPNSLLAKPTLFREPNLGGAGVASVAKVRESGVATGFALVGTAVGGAGVSSARALVDTTVGGALVGAAVRGTGVALAAGSAAGVPVQAANARATAARL